MLPTLQNYLNIVDVIPGVHAYHTAELFKSS